MFRRAIPPVFIILIFVYTTSVLLSQEEELISREMLIADIRQLATTLESAHPDPYINGGGKIAFHKRLHETVRAIPEDGISRQDFYKLLLPFIAAVKDGHTTAVLPGIAADRRLGIPFGLGIVDESLYVGIVTSEEYRKFLGAVLDGVEGVPISDLIERQKKLSGYDNDISNLGNLRRNLNLRIGLQYLLPEWQDEGRVLVSLKHRDGSTEDVEIALDNLVATSRISSPSKIELPPTDERDPNYSFLDEDKKTVILRIDNMISYREAFECFKEMGLRQGETWARHFYQKFHKTAPPEDLDEVIAGIPAVTETFSSLVVEMKEAETETLIIDLRRNGGGNSIMTDILIYFLYGFEAYEAVDQGHAILKYSELFFANRQGENLEEINEDRKTLLVTDDYNFDAVLGSDKEGEDAQEDKGYTNEYLEKTPTFMKERESGEFEAYYKPCNILVLTSPRTYSSGYWLAAEFSKMGAKIVGVPSGQAGNAFGDILQFTLANSGLQVTVSHKLFYRFPNDPEKGKLLRPDCELTYEKLKEYNFDPNASILLALDTLQ